MNSISYIIQDEHKNPITGAVEVLNGTDKETTVQKLCEIVGKIFLTTDIQRLTITAKSRSESLVGYIEKHTPAVDDAYISFGDYIHKMCDALVRAMHRKVEIQL